MKLSELIGHTSEWTGIPKPTVESVAKYLRPAGLLSSGGRGPGGAEMTSDDMVNLFIGVCGVEVANRAAEHVRRWRRATRIPFGTNQIKRVPVNTFALVKSRTIVDFFRDLIVKDLNGGPLDAWLNEGTAHDITLDFYIDTFSLSLAVSRVTSNLIEAAYGPVAEAHIDVVFKAARGEDEHQTSRKKPEYRATSQLIRRLSADNLRGWGTCLIEAAT
jgi:hypothetical protein